MENVGSSERTLTVFEIGLEPKVERQSNRCSIFRDHSLTPGGVAQLGERLPCKQEVMGSTPTISTKSKLGKTGFAYGLIAQLARALG